MLLTLTQLQHPKATKTTNTTTRGTPLFGQRSSLYFFGSLPASVCRVFRGLHTLVRSSPFFPLPFCLFSPTYLSVRALLLHYHPHFVLAFCFLRLALLLFLGQNLNSGVGVGVVVRREIWKNPRSNK